MDTKDQFLLQLLQKNARASTVSLARDLGLSRTATQERIAKLEKTGVIGGYTVVSSSMGEGRQIAHFAVKLSAGTKCAQVVPALRKIPQIMHIHSVAGAIDLLLMVEAESVSGVEAIRLLVVSASGIAEVTTYIVVQNHSRTAA
jgi:Lrp/AsnC family transcriptional regulator, leucine-responsive regulatory protein